MPIFQTVAAACRAAGEKLRSWKQKKRTDRLWRVVLWGILWAMLCPTLGACGAQREELFLSEKESIAYGDGSYVAESDVEDTDQNREAETNAGNTDEEEGETLQGRPSKQEMVQGWRKDNPNGTKYQCTKETGLSKNTVKKWW